MKLKLDANGNVVVENGMPVYIHDDGKEIPFDAVAAMTKITEWRGENSPRSEGSGGSQSREILGHHRPGQGARSPGDDDQNRPEKTDRCWCR